MTLPMAGDGCVTRLHGFHDICLSLNLWFLCHQWMSFFHYSSTHSWYWGLYIWWLCCYICLILLCVWPMMQIENLTMRRLHLFFLSSIMWLSWLSSSHETRPFPCNSCSYLADGWDGRVSWFHASRDLGLLLSQFIFALAASYDWESRN